MATKTSGDFLKLIRYLMPCLLTAVALAQWSGTEAVPHGKFELVGNYKDVGGVVASMVAPGAIAGTERFYASYLYDENTLDVVAIDPDTGEATVYRNPAPGEFGARNMAIGPDGNVYLGTLAHAHFLKLDRKLGKLIDLGRPSETEEYIWDVAFGADGKLYGATYPGCKLVRYDPASGQVQDLGPMDATEKYARWIAADGDGFVYVGIGTSKANVAAYDIKTGEHREVLPAEAQIVGIAKVYKGQDGHVYASAGKHLYELEKWSAKELPQGQTVAAAVHNVLKDGRVVTFSDSSKKIVVTDAKTNSKVEHKVNYGGNNLRLFRVAFGPDGSLYGSAMLPIHLVKVDLEQHTIDRIGDLGGGEVYSFLQYEKLLLIGTYSGLAPLMSFDPLAAVHPATEGNPKLVEFSQEDSSWRPQAMTMGHDGNVYIGAVAGYGKLESPLVEWDPKSGRVQTHDGIVRDESIISLTPWHDFMIGGTTTNGGGGSHATESEAKLFFWNLAAGKVESVIVPVPGATTITDLIAAPNGKIYGVADNTMFVLDPETRRVVKTQKLAFPMGLDNSIALGKAAIYNSIGVGSDGNLWGLAEDGIFRINTGTDAVELIARAPEEITGGFDMRGGYIYYISGPSVYRYAM